MNKEICIKYSLKGNWLTSSEDEVLSWMTSDNEPLAKKQKSQLPLFGFQKLIGQKSNAQQFPIHFIILELDTPNILKQRIKNGCIHTFEITQSKFWMWYNTFKYDVDLNYFWMYLTPSTCGIRFVLKLEKPVKNSEEYIHVVKSFLRVLYKKTNGAINQNHFDLLVNQGWFVPTFLDYFDIRENVFVPRLFEKETLVKK